MRPTLIATAIIFNALLATAHEEMITVSFPINSCEIDSTYSDNANSLRNLRHLLDEATRNHLVEIDSISISGHASPDGSLQKNLELSLRRAISLRDYVTKECKVPDSLLSFGENIVRWDMMRDIIASSSYPWRNEAMLIIDKGSDSNPSDNTRRMNRLKSLAGGTAWRDIKRDILPRLRSAYMVTTVLTVKAPEPATSNTAETDTIENLTESIVDSLPPQAPQPIVNRRNYDRFALKANAAYYAAGVTNIGAEIAVGDHWSIDFPIVFSPYTIARDYRLRLLYIQPEARYWLDRPLKGHFFGLHLHAGVANVSLDRDNRYQTPDGFYGGGISYGYSLPIARRWSVEFTVGAGYVYTKYDTYHNTGIPVGTRYKKDTPLHYWGIDKLGINFVYRFGDKSGKRKEVVVK